MIKHILKINNGVEAFGTTGKTITAEEQLEVCESEELAREISHLAEVVNERTCKFVVDNTLAAVVQKLSEGKAVVLPLDGKAALRIYPDVHLKAGSINEAKAAELGYNEITLENASEIVQKAGGVIYRAKAEVENPLTDALRALKPTVKLVDKKEIARIQLNSNQGGGNNNGGGSDPDDGTLG